MLNSQRRDDVKRYVVAEFTTASTHSGECRKTKMYTLPQGVNFMTMSFFLDQLKKYKQIKFDVS